MATFLPQHLVTLSAESWLCTTQGQNKTFTKFIVSRLACSAKADAVSIYLDVYGFIWIGNKRILFSTVATHWTYKQGFNRQMTEEYQHPNYLCLLTLDQTRHIVTWLTRCCVPGFNYLKKEIISLFQKLISNTKKSGAYHATCLTWLLYRLLRLWIVSVKLAW